MSNELQVQITNAPVEAQLEVLSFSPEQVKLLGETIAKGATEAELFLFVELCKRTRLNPFMRQIYMRKQRDNKLNKDVMVVAITIDGFRLIAHRTNLYSGQLGPFWCGKDAVWKDVWVSDEPPAAAKVGILRNDFKEPVWGIAKYSEYVQLYNEKPNSMWAKMPSSQLAKCAEALGLRKSFPHDLSGFYTEEEMAQARTVTEIKTVNSAKIELAVFAMNHGWSFKGECPVLKRFLEKKSAENLTDDMLLTEYGLDLAFSLLTSAMIEISNEQGKDSFIEGVVSEPAVEKVIEIDSKEKLDTLLNEGLSSLLSAKLDKSIDEELINPK